MNRSLTVHPPRSRGSRARPPSRSGRGGPGPSSPAPRRCTGRRGDRRGASERRSTTFARRTPPCRSKSTSRGLSSRAGVDAADHATGSSRAAETLTRASTISTGVGEAERVRLLRGVVEVVAEAGEETRRRSARRRAAPRACAPGRRTAGGRTARRDARPLRLRARPRLRLPARRTAARSSAGVERSDMCPNGVRAEVAEQHPERGEVARRRRDHRSGDARARARAAPRAAAPRRRTPRT